MKITIDFEGPVPSGGVKFEVVSTKTTTAWAKKKPGRKRKVGRPRKVRLAT